MKKLPICFSVFAALLLVCEASVARATTTTAAAAHTGGAINPGAPHGTITGLVRDADGRPLAGAVIRLLRENVAGVVKEARSAADGGFAMRAAPGRYVLQAVLNGFDGVQFTAVNVASSDELVYRFNLRRTGEGRTVAEQRADRDDPKFRVRGAHSRRSIFQAGAGEGEETSALMRDAAIAADAEQVLAAGIAGDDIAKQNTSTRLQGAAQTFFAASEGGLPYVGFNFALARQFNERIRLIISGQTGTPGSVERLDISARTRLGASRHSLRARVGAARLAAAPRARPQGSRSSNDLVQLSAQAIDEWVARDGVVVVVGFDYARFAGAGASRHTIAPRLGVQLDANATTRIRAAYAPGENLDAPRAIGRLEFEDGDVLLDDALAAPRAVAAPTNGGLLVERSRRLEFGVERVLDGSSRVEATAFFDTTDERGIGLQRLPASGFGGDAGAELLGIAEQEGAARGVRVVYARRLTGRTSVSAGYSFGRGQSLAPDAAVMLDDVESLEPQNIFRNGYFHTGAAQVDTLFETGTQIQAVVRFSSRATVFAVDPFAGQLAVYDPSLSIFVAQDLPNFGLPLRLRAIVDARNLLDVGAQSEEAETSIAIGMTRRSVRGGIAVRF